MSDINELFSRDPLQLTDDDITKIISYYRENRRLFNSNPVGTDKPKAKAAPKVSAKQKAALSLDLDLDL